MGWSPRAWLEYAIMRRSRCDNPAAAKHWEGLVKEAQQSCENSCNRCGGGTGAACAHCVSVAEMVEQLVSHTDGV